MSVKECKECDKFLSIQEFLPYQEGVGEHVIAKVELSKVFDENDNLLWVSPTVFVKLFDGVKSFTLPGEVWSTESIEESLSNLVRIKEILGETIAAARKLQEAIKGLNPTLPTSEL